MASDRISESAGDYTGTTRIVLGLEYRGADFCGWQLQHGVRTVQSCVEEALGRVADHPVRVICAGRTDTGVHALGQVVHFDTAAERTEHSWVFGANSHLPDDVSILWMRDADSKFHARFSALSRHYRYVVFNRTIRPAVLGARVAWYYRPLDVEPMQAAARGLIGRHDFSSYRSYACQAKHAVRSVYRLDVQRHGPFVVIDIVANAFLHHMVRNIAGVLLEIGSGRKAAGWAVEVLAARDRAEGGVTASPDGLYFVGVEYPESFRLPVRSEPVLIW